MFSNETTRYVNKKDRLDSAKLLTTRLTKLFVNGINDDFIGHLENLIDGMFHCINSIETVPIVGEKTSTDKSIQFNDSVVYEKRRQCIV